MPSQLQHELNKIRGIVSSTGQVFTSSIASLSNSINIIKENIKCLDSEQDTIKNKLNKISEKSSTALKKAKASLDTSVKKTGDIITGEMVFYKPCAFWDNIVMGGGKTVDGMDVGKSIGQIHTWIKYTNEGTGISMGTLPANVFVYDAYIHVINAFNDSGTDTIAIGINIDHNVFSTEINVDTTGIKIPNKGAGCGQIANSYEVFAYYEGQNNNANTGKAICILKWMKIPEVP